MPLDLSTESEYYRRRNLTLLRFLRTMPKTTTRRSSKEMIDEAKMFERWMNRGGKHVDVIRPMVALTTELIQSLKKITDNDRRFEIFKRYTNRIWEIEDRIFKRYPMHTTLEYFTDRGNLTYKQQAFLHGRSKEGRIEQISAATLLTLLRILSESGLLAKLRRCPCLLHSGKKCGKYFFVHRKTKMMSCPSCYSRTYKRLPGQKKKNRTYQREHYRRFLSRNPEKWGYPPRTMNRSSRGIQKLFSKNSGARRSRIPGQIPEEV